MFCRITSAIVALALLAGCANQPISTESLRSTNETRVLVFDKDFMYTNSKPGNVQRYVGILAGAYRAVYEDDDGVYYRGQGPSIVWADEPEKHEQYLAEGGVWISRVPSPPRFKIFRIIGTEITRSTSTGATAPWSSLGDGAATTAVGTQFAVDHVATGQSPASAGLGSAIGISIVEKIIELDRGKIKFDRDNPPPHLVLEGRYSEASTKP